MKLYSAAIIVPIMMMLMASQNAAHQAAQRSQLQTKVYRDEIKLGTSCVGLFESPNPLKFGDRNMDVVRLQNFLINDGEDIPAGPTGYFGTQTKAAVSDFQLKYSFQILYPLKLSAPTGAVYASTRAQIDALVCNN